MCRLPQGSDSDIGSATTGIGALNSEPGSIQLGHHGVDQLAREITRECGPHSRTHDTTGAKTLATEAGVTSHAVAAALGHLVRSGGLEPCEDEPTTT